MLPQFTLCYRTLPLSTSLYLSSGHIKSRSKPCIIIYSLCSDLNDLNSSTWFCPIWEGDKCKLQFKKHASHAVYVFGSDRPSQHTTNARVVIFVGPLPNKPYTSERHSVHQQPSGWGRQASTDYLRHNDKWKMRVNGWGRVGPNPDSLQWNEYKTELCPVPNLWLMDLSWSGADRWSVPTPRLLYGKYQCISSVRQ